MRRQFGVAVAHLRERQIDRIRNVPASELVGLTHVDQQGIGAIELQPVGHGHVAVQHVLGQHPGKVDGVFRRAELRGIAQLGLGQIVHGAAN